MATLNHIGIAILDLPRMKELFSLLGLHIQHQELVADQGVRTHFLPLPLSQGNLELLEPIEKTGTVVQFLEKKGPGIHHLSFSLENGELLPTCERLRAAGFRLIYSQPREGAQGMRINFIHPSTSGGILIELMELHEYK